MSPGIVQQLKDRSTPGRTLYNCLWHGQLWSYCGQ